MAMEMVGDAVAALVGSPDASVEGLSGFVGNQDFLVRTSSGDYVLKAGQAASIAAEAWACERVRREGVPAPEIVAVDLDRAALPLPFLLMRRMPGGPVDDGHDALAEAGRQVRTVHEIAVDGYGFLHETSGWDGVDARPRGPHPDWHAVIAAPVRTLDGLVDAAVLDDALAGRLRAGIESHRSLLDGARRGVLLHGDLHPRHVFAAHGRLSGIIDWGDVAVGDPHFELGRFSRSGAASLDVLLRGYQPDPDPEFDRKLTLYRVVWSLLALGWEFDAGGDWFAGHIDAISEGLDLLARSG